MKQRTARMLMWMGAATLVAVAVAVAFRRRTVEAAPTEADWASERLRAFEAERHRTTDFTKLVPWSASSGPDPYAIRRVPGSSHMVGILRGDDSLVLLDASLRELQRLSAPASPSGLAVGDDGYIYAVGELSPTIARFVWKDGRLVPAGTLDLGAVRALRGIAAGPAGWLYVVEEHDSRMIGVQWPSREDLPTKRDEIRVGVGPVAIERVRDRVIVNCVLDHALYIQKLEPSGRPSRELPIRIAHDGPLWSFAASAVDGALRIAAAGVENRPLDRTIGAFGYVDSFLYLYDVDLDRKAVAPRAVVNLSELGVVTPKAITLHASPPVSVTVTGYGSDQRLDLEFAEDLAQPPKVTPRRFLPGASSVALLDDGALVFADPLLDAWLRDVQGGGPEVVPVGGSTPESDPLAHLGEALFFTTSMGPWNRSDGALSRFTCETCHFEGYVDGRIHHTGRDDIHAVTKPLLGLFNNRPHFSRALDPDLVAVAFNEFRVAGAKSGHDHWFPLSTAELPWLARLGQRETSFSPETLRKALMAFLMTFNHRPNPMVVGRTRWSPEEGEGATLFRDRCASCHEARLVSDEPGSRVPFERWEELVMTASGPIVWGKAEYAKTGVVPYVHTEGARVPSLRRLYKKYPYFTNGSAKTLQDVLARARFVAPDGGRSASGASAGGFWHEAPDGASGDALDQRARAALLRFLDLL